MHMWNWQTWNGLPYLTCSLLEPWQHGFFTQQFWSRSPADLTSILQPTATSYRVKQVHGNIVLAPSEVEAMQPRLEAEAPPADGLMTEQPNQAVWVCSADCTPVLIADGQTGQVAAVHAGWRGTAQKIVPQAIARLQAQGSNLTDLRIALGPAISGEVYQVSEQVAAEVGSTIIGSDAHQSFLLADPEPGRVRLDVRRVNVMQLEQVGIQPEQIAIAPHCTFQDSQNFFSYRRLREKKAQWSGIVSRSIGQTF